MILRFGAVWSYINGLARLLLTEKILVSIKLAYAHFRDTDSSSGFSLTEKQLKCYYDEIFIFFFQPFFSKIKYEIQMQTKGNYHESRPS